MREVISGTEEEVSTHNLAVVAHEHSLKGIQSYDDMGVGAAVSFKRKKGPQVRHVAYAGTNMNISGMQTKVHAEQFALQQAMLDFENERDGIETTMKDMVVVVTGDKDYLTCGHCLQITRSVCEYLGCSPRQVNYIAASHKGGEMDEFDFREEKLDELLSTTYAEW